MYVEEGHIVQIVELKVEGYRTLKNVVWKPGNLNIIIGPNASGKSNLLKLLELISKAAQGSLADAINQSGGMLSVLWNGHGEAIKTNVVLTSHSDELTTTVNYLVELKKVGTSSYAIDTERISYVDKRKQEYEPLNISILERKRPDLFYEDVDDDRVDTLDHGIFNSPETLLSRIKNFPDLSIAISHVSSDLNQFSIHQGFRTDKDARVRQPVISSFEESLDLDGQNLTSVLHTVYESDINFQENIDRAMRAAFGDDYKGLAFPPAGSQRVELGLRWKSLSRPQPSAVLSDGTLRFLFLITAISLPRLPSLICIDEPETGLHPSMLPIIAEYAANAAQRTQVVFTTHSVQFLDAFSEYAPTTTVAQLQDGETKLVTLDGEKLAYWLRNYSLGALFSSGELENMAADALDEANEDAAGEVDVVGGDAE